MALKKYKLGDLIEPSDDRNDDGILKIESVRGISTGKEFIETKANMDGVSLSSYKIVKQYEFAYVSDTSRRGDKISLAYNKDSSSYLVSSISTVFFVKRPKLLLSDYLFIYFNRPEFDRFSRFNSWGSARETFSWDDLCNIDITLPDLPTQQKYVDIYESMVANQKSYEQGLDDLKLTCDAFLDKLKKECDKQEIGKYLEPSDLRNDDEKLNIENLRGISTEKSFIDTKADMLGVSLKNYKVVKQNEFVYVADTSRRGDKVALGFNDSNESCLVSSIYTVFRIKDVDLLNPQYLMMFFTRNEFDRYARFNSWGSARETFDWSEMSSVKIPIPDINVQKSIADIYKVYAERKRINEQLKQQIKDICPILIKGSLEE